MATLYNQGGSAMGTFEVSCSASGSTVSANASVSLYAGYAWYMCTVYFTLYVDGTQVQQVKQNTMGGSGSGYSPASVSLSGSKSCSDGTRTVTLEVTTSATGSWIPRDGQSTSASCTVSTWSSGSFTIGSSSGYITDNLSITMTNGNNNSWNSLKWTLNGSTGYLTASSQTLDLSMFESYMTNVTSATLSLTGYQTHGSSITRSYTLNIPDTYVPTIKITELEKIDAVNYALIAGQSSFKIYYEAGVTPEDNQATIASVLVTSTTFSPDTVPGSLTYTYDATAQTITSSVLPAFTAGSSYNVKLIITATDTRGRYVTEEVQIPTVYSYVPPYLSINQLGRCDSTGAMKPSGQYCYCEINVSNPDGSTITQTQIKINNITYNLTFKSGTATSCVYSAIVGDNLLNIGNQYPVIIYLRNQTMVDYGDPALEVVSLLPTMQMPISLYDDGSLVGTSIGEMATQYTDLLDTTSVINFASKCQVRTVSNDGATVKVFYVYDILTKCPYEVGDVYCTTLSSDPSTIWSGTTWTLLTTYASTINMWQRNS